MLLPTLAHMSHHARCRVQLSVLFNQCGPAMLLTRAASHSARKIPIRIGAQAESALFDVLIMPPRSSRLRWVHSRHPGYFLCLSLSLQHASGRSWVSGNGPPVRVVQPTLYHSGDPLSIYAILWEFASGSVLMPFNRKKNLCELLRGLCACPITLEFTQ